MSGSGYYRARRRWAPYPWTLLALVAVLTCGSLTLLGLGHKLAQDEAQAGPADLSPAERADHLIRSALSRQTAALLGGDEPGWLRDVDPPLAGEMRRLYANLRGLQISGWVPDPAGPPATEETGPAWRTDVRIRVCFTGPTCTTPSTDLLTASTAWRVTDDRAVLTAFTLDSGARLPSRPTPWERGVLTFASGARVIVAAAAGKQQPADWLPAAERAAILADRFTLSEPRVGKYLVFLAGRWEWRTWFSAFTARDVVGYAVRPSDTSGFIVIDTTRVKPGAHGETVLRHEMAHLATRFGPSTRVGAWATEGIAEYVAWAGHPISAYDRTAEARALAAKIQWRQQLDLEWSHSSTHRSGYYGMGFFAMRCLSEMHGEQHMLNFFDLMAHGGRGAAQASGEAFGVSWAAAQRGCAPRINTWLGG